MKTEQKIEKLIDIISYIRSKKEFHLYEADDYNNPVWEYHSTAYDYYSRFHLDLLDELYDLKLQRTKEIENDVNEMFKELL